MARIDSESAARHERRRRAKRILRMLPRRAVFHRYPVVGRFAAAARRRAYLWSFRPAHVRPAIYLGAIVSLWPVMGIQIAVVFLASIIFRANLMVAGGLQLLSNPLTAAPLYYLTYRAGKAVMQQVGYRTPTGQEMPEEMPADVLPVDVSDVTEISGFRATVVALFIGGTLCGLAFGVLLDLLYLWSVRVANRQRPAP